MTLIIYEKSPFFFFFFKNLAVSESSPLRSFFSYCSPSCLLREQWENEKRRREDEERGVNKIPINLHYTINPMRGRQHGPFWIFSSLFPQDRSCERAPIRGKVPFLHRCEGTRGDLFTLPNIARERRSRGDRSLFHVVHRIYASDVYILPVYEPGNIQRQFPVYALLGIL